MANLKSDVADLRSGEIRLNLITGAALYKCPITITCCGIGFLFQVVYDNAGTFMHWFRIVVTQLLGDLFPHCCNCISRATMIKCVAILASIAGNF